MKKILTAALAVTMVLSLSACMDYEYSVKIDAAGDGSATISAGFEESTVDDMAAKGLISKDELKDGADVKTLSDAGISYRTDWTTTIDGKKYSGSSASFKFSGLEDAKAKTLTLLNESSPMDPFSAMSIASEDGKWYLDFKLDGVSTDEATMDKALENELAEVLKEQSAEQKDLGSLSDTERAALIKKMRESLNISYTVDVAGTLVSQKNGTAAGSAVTWQGLLSDIEARWEISEAQAKALQAKVANFVDIDGHWAEDYLLDMFQRGVMEGKGKGKMAPDATITRAEAATMMQRMFESIQPKPETAREAMHFPDVDDSNWFYSYVKWAYENNVVNGMKNGKYEPNKTLTRQELMQMLYNELDVLGYLDKGTVKTDGSTDANVDAAAAWAKEAAKFCLDNDLPHLNADGTIDPKGDAPRAEFAYMLYQVANKFIEA